MTKFYISTPIYYPSAKLHLGHAYTTVVADALARYHRLRGHDTWFLTGTDEHGQKIERAARAAGMTPQAFVDDMAVWIKNLWQVLHISYDDFIRTTETRHKAVVQQIFRRLHAQGDIYKGSYEGWYCIPCEAFWVEGKLKEGNLKEGNLCPDCERPVELTKEEAYFLRLSKYADALLRHVEEIPDFIQPSTRRNEMISFIKQGLEDLCVSRASVKWGVEVPFAADQVIYVWIDALSNYVTALGYGAEDQERYQRYWPADLHLVGKEIMRFHTIVWPIILMALGEPLPKQVYGHGWLLFGSAGDKMSKSRGNVVDPHTLVEQYGLDTVRYYLLRQGPYGPDCNYTEDALILSNDVDLANDLGNLLSRTTAMINKFAGAQVPAYSERADDRILRDLAAQVIAEYEAAMDRREIGSALTALFKLVGRANKYIEEQAPWTLAKDPAKAERLSAVLYSLAESLRILAVGLTPFLIHTPEKIWDQLGLNPEAVRAGSYEQAKEWGGLEAGTTVRRGEPLFPRRRLKAM